MAEEQKRKLTYNRKKPATCKICNTEFKVEEILTGGGRLIAGDLTSQLRRLYEESPRYGKVRPVIYSILVCPNCYFAAFSDDFDKIPRNTQDKIDGNRQDRKHMIMQVFDLVDFTQPRDLVSGAAAYMLGTACYSWFDWGFNPTLKKAICSIRTYWLLGDLYRETGDEQYAYIQNIFMQKAQHFYGQVIENEQKGQEMLSGVSCGPDIDKNWGYDGIKYMYCRLTYDVAPLIDDLHARADQYLKIKQMMGRLFGLGESSKERPGPLLDIARTLYDNVAKRVKELENELGEKLTPY